MASKVMVVRAIDELDISAHQMLIDMIIVCPF